MVSIFDIYLSEVMCTLMLRATMLTMTCEDLMYWKFKQLLVIVVIALYTLVISTDLVVAEEIISTQTAAFEDCIKVIDVTTDRVGIKPTIISDTSNSRVAEFATNDGTVIIKCDAEAKEITVSVK